MPYRWTHSDNELAAQAALALDRAAAEDWETPGAVRALRALLVMSAEHQAELVGEVVKTPVSGAGAEGRVGRDALEVRVGPLASVLPDEELPTGWDERTFAARVLQGTWDALAGGAEPELSSFTTNGDGAAVAADDTGLHPAVVIVGVIVAGGAIAYLGHRTLETIDRQLQRDAAARGLLQAHAAAERLIDAHLEAEAAAGKPLPLSEPVREQLEHLRGMQDRMVPTPPPDAPAPGGEWSWLAIAGLVVGGALAAPGIIKALKGT